MNEVNEIRESTGRLLDLEGISHLLGVSPKTVYYWVSRHEIPFLKVGRHLRFQASDVIEFFHARTLPPKPLANPPK